MKESVYHVTAILAALVLLFTMAAPVQAQPGGLNMNQTTLPGDPSLAKIGEAAEEPRPLAAAPIITVWYEDTLQFGGDGNPQTQINILGNVRDTDGSVSSLTYRLNGGASQTLKMGPDGLRLENRGDFNIAIDITRLIDGNNTVVISARDNSGEVANKTVTFPYTANRTWRLPYATYWAAGTIHSQSQVVDGLWRQTGGGVRPVQVGYDRVIAIGDMNWTNYEVLVPITTHGFYPDPADTNDAGGVGIIARWIGHTGSGSLPSGWTRIGAYAYYSNRLRALALRTKETNVISQSFNFRLGVTYMFKLRVETSPTRPTTDGVYSFKIWESGTPEPSWNDPAFSRIVNVTDPNDELLRGSVLLVAHRADATFGNVTIYPLDATCSLNVSVNGGGSVSKSPNKTSYSCGESVTLTATPSAGWEFVNWSGGVNSTNSQVTFNITSDENVTANFRRLPVDLPYDFYAPFVNNK